MRFEVDAILFDIDGTLVDSTSAVTRSWTKLADRHGMDPERILSVCHGRRSRDTIEDLFPPESHDDAERELHALELSDLSEVIALPGTAALLTRLPTQRWAAVTSGDRELMTARLSAGQVPVPEVMITSEDVTVGKPDPQGYRLAAERLGFDPVRCLVVEDAPAGLQAGSAAGAHVLAVTTSHDAAQVAPFAHSVVGDLSELSVTVDDDGGLVVESLSGT
ncbi:HAD family hydrolase [Kocuria soli]|uniref:HAD family hydrolase n=1 Tax=Kocuria soli TaxID=2485125 RepID=A0A3N4A8V7_9MICC|nr:HAD family hydrolase [Kocuria soli]ROZ61964.1 HAD family hydrolase [Kocuria soli]